MSIVKAYDVSHVRFRAPDLDKMQQFLRDFGMIDAELTTDRLSMRGYGTAPFLHTTERGEAGFIGFGLWVSSMEDLERLAAYDNVPVQPFDAPGGGDVVRLVDPDGFVVEVIAGHDSMPPQKNRPTPSPRNEDGRLDRLSDVRRVTKGPSHVLRLGHVVLSVSNFRRSEAWYKERFGLLTSDEIQPAPDHAVGAFMRCDRGDVPCDHHTLFLFERSGSPAFIHSAFEVVDVDDLMAGHDYLVRNGYTHFWGVGRHLLGSQIFDYWVDPWGHEIEHWTDGDQFTAHDVGGVGSIDDLLGVQWGGAMPTPPTGTGPTR